MATRRRRTQDAETQRRWGIGLMGALALGLGVAVLAPPERLAHAAPEAARPAPPQPPVAAAQPSVDEQAARAQAAFWVWPMVGSTFEQQDLSFDE